MPIPEGTLPPSGNPGFDGGVRIGGWVSPTDYADTYPTHLDLLGKGGFRAVDANTDRDSIAVDRRSWGMMVYVIADAKFYQLRQINSNNKGDNLNWFELQFTASELLSANLPITTNGQTSFTIPAGAIVMRVAVNGDNYYETESFTLSGTTLTRLNPFVLATNDRMKVFYK